jgi:hypothetical protein
MEITIDELLAGKGTRIKNNEYFPTAGYVEPFLERMSKFTNDFRVQVKLPDQITLTNEGNINKDDVTYNRVWIQAVLPDEYCFENHQEVIGMVYGLDVRKPIYKIYKGGLNMACTNLCIFNPDFLDIQEIEPETAVNFRNLERLMEQTDDMRVRLNNMFNMEIPYIETDIDQMLGKWVRNTIDQSYDKGFGKVKLATSTAIDAYKLLYCKKDSPYYVEPGQTTNMFNVYNAFTQLITDDDRDIVNKAEKTLLLQNILEI